METKYKVNRSSLGTNIGISTLVGLMGGLLLGVKDSITVILNHAPRPFPLFDILFFSLYPVALSSLIGCLGMMVISIIITILIRIGGYSLNRAKLAGLYVGIFVLFTSSILLSDMIGITSSSQISTVFDISLISILCSITLGGLTVYLLEKDIKRDRLVALCISLSISLLVFLYSLLWMNINLLPEFWKPVSLLSDMGLLVVTGLLGLGIYVLLISIFQRGSLDAKRQRLAGLILSGAAIFVFGLVSLFVNYGGENIDVESKDRSVIRESKPLPDLKDRPNILLIVMDTLRADHLSCYGYNRNTTPNIDRIAAEGALFENTISNASWTLPAHASIFTGMFSSKHGANSEHLYLDDRFTTIAELMRLYGYKTFGISNNYYIVPKTNFDQGFDVFKWIDAFTRCSVVGDLSEFLLINKAIWHIKNLLDMTDEGAYKTNKIVKEWIDSSHYTKSPFFIFINYMEAHGPYGGTPYSGLWLDKDISAKKAKGVNQNTYVYLSGKKKMSDKVLQIFRDLYDGDISYLDFRIGQIFDYLRELEILDKTIVIITSDHGENFGEHNLIKHHLCIYDTVLHVPLIIRYPEAFKPGLRIKRQVQLTDIFPTVLDILGVDLDGIEDIQGHTLLQRPQQHNQSFAVAEYILLDSFLDKLSKEAPDSDLSAYVRRLKAIRTDEYKYIWASDGRNELYKIDDDPKELNNLIKTRPQKAKELAMLLNDWLNSFENYKTIRGRERIIY